jgi:2-polyprenyl-6-methoxyphenol hydroxylase-like FAD-dependent oxidoreductase
VSASTAGSSGQIVVAGAGYAGLHVALRLTAKLRNHPKMTLTLVDRHDYHQVLTELPRVAGRGVADIAGITSGGHLAHLLKDAIEWEYRQSVTHLRGWDPVAL